LWSNRAAAYPLAMQFSMASARPAALAVLVILGTVDRSSAIATGSHVAKESISPPLDPESHKEFFNKEYPKDFQPSPHGVHGKFDYPYPIVQDSGDYDKDYVKDENDDGGEWKAQTHYDFLRSKIQKQRSDAEDTAKESAEAKAKYDAAKAKADAAKSTADAASKEAGDASKAEDETEGALKKLIGKDAVDGKDVSGNSTSDGEADGINGTSGVNDTEIGGEVGEGVKKVENEMNGLKNCQEELAAAREKLKKAMEEADKREKARNEAKEAAAKAEAEQAEAEAAALANATTAEEKAAIKKRAAHAAKLSDIEKKDAEEVDAAQAEADAARKKVEELEKLLQEEESQFKTAESAYDKDTKEVAESEAGIAKAADRLRKFRKADANGGVYSVQPKKSGAVSSAVSVALLVAVCALSW